MAAGEEERHLLSPGAGGSYLGAAHKDGHGAVQDQAPALALGPRRSQHCHTGGATGHRGQQRQARRRLYLAAGICLLFMAGEAVGEWRPQGLRRGLTTGTPQVAACSTPCSDSLPRVQARPPTAFQWVEALQWGPPTAVWGDLISAQLRGGSPPLSPQCPHDPFSTGGYLAHSLAILTDAAHLLTDFASIMISLFALWVSSRPPTKTMNFGWHRAEILGALLSVLSIWVVTGVLVYLAAQRLLSDDYDIEGGVMLITSACAVAVNVVMGVALHQTGHRHSHGAASEQLNTSVRAAFVHVVGDLLQSVGVLIASYIIFFKPEYKYVDPICTFLFSALVLGTTLTILRDVLLVLMEGTPKGIDFNAVRETLLAVQGVEAVHSLHIWSLTAAQPLLSVHVAIRAGASAQEVLEEASSRLQGTFHFHTTTIQVENYSEEMQDCRECQPPRD
uniref:Solute carrier family 30 member 2 n=1 Tax=Strigops habroptila TaxID=2489341 RepID=A0A672TXI9_STRHB